MIWFTRVAFAFFLTAAGAASAQTNDPGPGSPVATVTASRLENIPIYRPQGRVRAVVAYISDKSGWTAEDDKNVAALKADGNAILGIDYARYSKALDADTGECLYVVGELTDLAQTAQRQLGLQTYRQPILAGVGEGATFAYAALADSPPNTLSGAVASGFTNRLSLKLPFCPGAKASKNADGSWSYGFDQQLPDAAVLLVEGERKDEVTAGAELQDAISVDDLADDRTAQIVTEVRGLSDNDRPFGDLPAIDLPSTTEPKALAVFVSGDGGWRDLDKTMGEWLSTQGIHVIGLDALHYFWAKKTPTEFAHDLAAVIQEADPTENLPVMLIGYSFGADTIPFAYPELPQVMQDRTKVLALLAPGVSTSFQVTVAGWLGVDDSGYEIAPAIAKLPAEKVICFYGKEEDGSACTEPALKGMTIVPTDGGHHFDGDYRALAGRILEKLP